MARKQIPGDVTMASSADPAHRSIAAVPRLGLLMMAAGFVGLFGMLPAIWSLGLTAAGAAVIALAVLRFLFA